MVFDIKGKMCLVTGGANGIGLGYVTELLKNGAQGVMIGDMSVMDGEEAAQKLNKQYGATRVTFMKCDVTKQTDLESLFEAMVRIWKGIDIVINNAGILNDNIWETQIAINCNGVVHGTLLAMKYMGKDMGGRGGVVVNIASILGLQPLAGCPIYTGTKHFVVGFDRSIGTPFYFNRTGIKVLTMCPGVTDTPLISEAGSRALERREDVSREVVRGLTALPPQPVENVAKGMMTLITKGENGSVWVCEGNKPIYEVDIPDRNTYRK